MRNLLCVLSVLVITGCAHKGAQRQDALPTSSPPPASSANDSTSSTASGSDKSCGIDTDCGDKQLCIRGHCVDISAGLAECTQVRVHFPFNSADMDEGEKGGLERAARCLRADHKMHVTVEGNADERGTEEYNLALGDRRATVIARYLKRLRVSAEQLKTVSYGKENPLCSEHDEDCWAKNRRADLRAAEAKLRK
jgi:peptidoglycan-associated lipoprotein